MGAFAALVAFVLVILLPRELRGGAATPSESSDELIDVLLLSDEDDAHELDDQLDAELDDQSSLSDEEKGS